MLWREERVRTTDKIEQRNVFASPQEWVFSLLSFVKCFFAQASKFENPDSGLIYMFNLTYLAFNSDFFTFSLVGFSLPDSH